MINIINKLQTIELSSHFCNSDWSSPSPPWPSHSPPGTWWCPPWQSSLSPPWRLHSPPETWPCPPASKATPPGIKTTYTGDTLDSANPEAIWKMYSFSVLVDFETPEECQETCRADSACAGFTSVQSKFLPSSSCYELIQIHVPILKIKRRWTTENSDVIPLACVLFSDLGQDTPCQNCVSGQP